MNTKTTVTMPNDRELVVTRRFSASAKNVFAAYTRPELVKRWLNGPDGWSLEVCEIDLRVGGRFRYEWRSPEGETMGMGGEYREIAAPARLVTTELYDADWTGGETLVTTHFREDGDGTAVATTIRYSSREARDRALETGMTDGMEATYRALDEALGAPTAERSDLRGGTV